VVDDTDDLVGATPVTSFTIRNEGRYFMMGSTKWAAGSGGYRALEIQKNGSQLSPCLWYPGTDIAEQNTSASDYLRAGDVITLKAATTSAGNLNIATSRFSLGFFSS